MKGKKDGPYKYKSTMTKKGKVDMKSNCKCVDDDNYCTVCYNPIDIDNHNYQIITSIKYRDSKLLNSI